MRIRDTGVWQGNGLGLEGNAGLGEWNPAFPMLAPVPKSTGSLQGLHMGLTGFSWG